VLDEKPTNGITASLTSPDSVSGNPYRLKANEGKSFIGSYVLGLGFVLTPDEAQALIAQNARNKDVLFPYLNGEDLNSGPDQSPTRWVINFFDWPLERAAEYPACLQIVEQKVKPERTRKDEKDEFVLRKPLPQKWWIYADKRPELYKTIAGMERVLVTARVSAHHFLSYPPANQVFADRLAVLAVRGWGAFALLSSTLHDAWAHRPGATTHETRNTYFPEQAFETFPFPETLAELEVIGERYHEYRRQLTFARNEGLRDAYNRFHDPDENSTDIQQLRQLHVEMDQAVVAAYGWTDLDLGHGFHQTKQGLRYTISEAARREVLARLLKLNHERYAEEVSQGLHEKKRPQATKDRKEAQANTQAGANLFHKEEDA